jgi:luciferase family oxidoreductase group 1
MAEHRELKLGVLDQSPMAEDETASEALSHTIELAQKTEEWGYHRFWVAEHHASGRVMGSSPEVLVSHLLAKTSRIRVGSGGVMLQHYSPFKVAENFNVLASLAPGRVDLGIGRGPGGHPMSTKALQQDRVADPTPLGEKLTELQRFLHNSLEEDHPLYGLRPSPTPPQPADVYLLGTTDSSAHMAASMALPYVFALFLNSDDEMMARAMEAYHAEFDHSLGAEPEAMLALPVIVAETDEEAQALASEVKVVRIRLESGRTLTVGSVEAGEEFGRQSGEAYEIMVKDASVVHGSPALARQKLLELQKQHRADEIIAVTAIREFAKRLRSYELLGQAFSANGTQ